MNNMLTSLDVTRRRKFEVHSRSVVIFKVPKIRRTAGKKKEVHSRSVEIFPAQLYVLFSDLQELSKFVSIIVEFFFLQISFFLSD